MSDPCPTRSRRATGARGFGGDAWLLERGDVAAERGLRPGLDPVTLEIIHGALEAAIREMEALVDRTAMSAMIKEKKDRFVGIYDAAGRMVAAHLSFSRPGPDRAAPGAVPA